MLNFGQSFVSLDVKCPNNLSEVHNLPENEEKDAFYSAVVNAVSQILNIEFMSKSMTAKLLTYDNLKLYIMQVESIKVQAATVATEPKTAYSTSMDSVRCYECDGFGRMSKNCPRLGSGKIMCFECKQFTSHIAVNCPQRQQRLRGENSRYESSQYRSGNRGDRGGRYSGNKRKGDSVDCHSDSKKSRPDKHIVRGNKLSWRGRRRGGVKGDTTEPKDKASDHGPEIKIDTK